MNRMLQNTKVGKNRKNEEDAEPITANLKFLIHSFILFFIPDHHVIKQNNKCNKEQFKNWSQEQEEATQRQTLKYAEDKKTLILNDRCMVATPRNKKSKKNIIQKTERPTHEITKFIEC